MRLRKQVYIYFSTSIINAGLSFLIVSLLTHHLSTYDYGIINLYSAFLIFLMPFVSGGILYPISVEFFKKPHDEYRLFFSDAQALALIRLGVITLLCILLQHPLSRFLKVTPFWIWIMPVTVWWIMINETTTILTRSKNKPFQFAFFSIGKTILEIGITLLLVLGLSWKWEGRITAAAVAPFLLGIFSLYLFYRWDLFQKKLNWQGIRQIMLLSLPFVYERLAVFVLSNSDKYFIDRFDLNGTREVGLYGLGGQIAYIIFIAIVSMNSAYNPYIFQQMSGGLKERFHRVTLWYIAGLGAAIGCVMIAIPILFKWFIAKEYHGAQLYAYLLCGGYFMWGVYNAFLPYLLYLRKNKQIMIISILGMVTSLLLNIFIVPKYGARGAAVTSVATYFLMALTCYGMTRKYFLKTEPATP